MPLQRVIRTFNFFTGIFHQLNTSVSNEGFFRMPAITGVEALKLAQKLWKLMSESASYERALQKVSITSAGNGACTAEFKVEQGLSNQLGTLHGGCTATIVDCISSVGLMTMGGQKVGVSVNLSINYLSAAKIGAIVEIETKTVKCGKTLAYLEAVLKNKENGKVIATGSHIKFIGD